MTEYIQLDLFDNEPEQEQPEQRAEQVGSTAEEWHQRMMSRPYPGSPNWTAEMEAQRQKDIAEIRQWAKEYCEANPDKCVPIKKG